VRVQLECKRAFEVAFTATPGGCALSPGRQLQKVMPLWMQCSKVLLALALTPLGLMQFRFACIRMVSRFKRAAATV